jgi:hypothetical protein
MKSRIIVQDAYSIQTEENGTILLILAVVPLVITTATADYLVFHRTQPLTLEGVSGQERIL